MFFIMLNAVLWSILEYHVNGRDVPNYCFRNEQVPMSQGRTVYLGWFWGHLILIRCISQCFRMKPSRSDINRGLKTHFKSLRGLFIWNNILEHAKDAISERRLKQLVFLQTMNFLKCERFLYKNIFFIKCIFVFRKWTSLMGLE